ncbi:MAG: PLAT/LH2 domain-containing protein [Acidimicrobiales bacterium]
MPTYRIEVHTGSLSSGALSCSDANIYLTLYGTGGSTDELVLHPSLADGSENGGFSLPLGELGDVQRLRVRYDDTGLSPAWFLDRITIRNESSGSEWTFPCHRWLARHMDDGEIERTLDVA